MRTGVSTSSLFPLETEKALRRLGELGIRRAEIFLNAPSESKPDFVAELHRIAQGEGIRIVSLHPYCSDTEGMLFFGRYPRRFSDGMDEYRRMFEACGVLGAEKLIFHGARRGIEIPWKVYFERFARVFDEAKKYNVLLCQENVARCMSYNPDMLRAMHEALPQVRFVLDTKQALRSGSSPIAVARAVGTALAHVHISDYNSQCDCIIPGQGKFNFAEFFGELTAGGYDGDVITELYRWNFADDTELLAGQQVIIDALAGLSPAAQEGAEP